MKKEIITEDIFNEIKTKIKKISEKEKKCLRSISFSTYIDKKEIIIYFTWNKERYDNYYKDRDIFRNNIKEYLNSKHFYLNVKESNSARYNFYYRYIDINGNDK